MKLDWGKSATPDGVAIGDGTLSETYNLVELGTQLVTQFSAISGTLNLNQGGASGTIDLGDGSGERPGTLDFANLLSTYAGDLLDDLDGTVPFQNGRILVDLPTPFGQVSGTLDFATGQLISDLTTPFGDVNFTIDFPEGTRFDLPLGNGISGVLDLDRGVVDVDLLPTLPGGTIVIPLTSFSGSVDFRANAPDVLNVGLANSPILGTVSTTIDLAQEAETALSEFLTSVTGNLSVANGSLTANLNSSVGNFTGTLDVAQYATDLIATLPSYNGTLTFSGGEIVANLTTPGDPISGSFNYGQYLDQVANLVIDLGLA